MYACLKCGFVQDNMVITKTKVIKDLFVDLPGTGIHIGRFVRIKLPCKIKMVIIKCPKCGTEKLLYSKII